MNAIATTSPPVPQDEIIRVLENSLYPGARPESIALVLSYCRVNGMDPLLKPVHIVPTSVKTPSGWTTRDVLMPGIADYRIKAARSGEYGGKSEPEFGPEKATKIDGVAVAYPEWCRITVSRIVHGAARTFTATERWVENYATDGKSDAPNRMWRKRPYGQLAKCAEAQALRMAFPEFSGGQPTAEEMEGKEQFAGPTLEAQAEATDTQTRTHADTQTQQPLPPKMSIRAWLDDLQAECEAATTQEAANAILGRQQVMEADEKLPEAAAARLRGIRAATLSRLWPRVPAGEEDGEYTDAEAAKVMGSA